jgi:hypothetical protein
MNGAFYTLSQAAATPPTATQVTLLSNLHSFLNGYEHYGLTQGASVMFVSLFDAGYNLGYSFGSAQGTPATSKWLFPRIRRRVSEAMP